MVYQYKTIIQLLYQYYCNKISILLDNEPCLLTPKNQTMEFHILVTLAEASKYNIELNVTRNGYD